MITAMEKIKRERKREETKMSFCLFSIVPGRNFMFEFFLRRSFVCRSFLFFLFIICFASIYSVCFSGDDVRRNHSMRMRLRCARHRPYRLSTRRCVHNAGLVWSFIFYLFLSDSIFCFIHQKFCGCVCSNDRQAARKDFDRTRSLID